MAPGGRLEGAPGPGVRPGSALAAASMWGGEPVCGGARTLSPPCVCGGCGRMCVCLWGGMDAVSVCAWRCCLCVHLCVYRLSVCASVLCVCVFQINMQLTHRGLQRPPAPHTSGWGGERHVLCFSLQLKRRWVGLQPGRQHGSRAAGPESQLHQARPLLPRTRVPGSLPPTGESLTELRLLPQPPSPGDWGSEPAEGGSVSISRTNFKKEGRNRTYVDVRG